MGLRSQVSMLIPVRVPMLIPVYLRKCSQWELQYWSLKQWTKVAWSDESCFLLHHTRGLVHVGQLWDVLEQQVQSM